MQISPIVIAHAQVTYDKSHLCIGSVSILVNSLAEVSTNELNTEIANIACKLNI